MRPLMLSREISPVNTHPALFARTEAHRAWPRRAHFAQPSDDFQRLGQTGGHSHFHEEGYPSCVFELLDRNADSAHLFLGEHFGSA